MKLFIDHLWLSPYAFSVYNALREKDLSFDLEEIAFQSSQSTTETFKDRTFTDLIPALSDGEFVLSESMAILEYIEEKFPSPRYISLFPSNLQDRAEARMLLNWYRTGLSSLRKERSAETIFYPAQNFALLPLSSDAKDEVGEWLRCLRSIFKPGAAYLFGAWSIADTETAFMLYRLVRNNEVIDDDLKTYAHGIWQRPALQEYLRRDRKPFRSYYV